MSDAADRLRRYCARAVYARTDPCENGHGREVRCLDADLRRIVWNDTEVRRVLLAAGEDRNTWKDLVELVGDPYGLPLLDLVSAMALEMRDRGVVA